MMLVGRNEHRIARGRKWGQIQTPNISSSFAAMRTAHETAVDVMHHKRLMMD